MKSESLGILGYDSFHFAVENIERSRVFYTHRFDFDEVARAQAAARSHHTREQAIGLEAASKFTAALGLEEFRVGGINGGNKPENKLHLHWRLAVPARTTEEHANLKLARRVAQQLVGSDGSAVPPVHPLLELQ